MIARTPAFKFINEKYPHVSMTIWWQDYIVDLVKYLLPDNERLQHRKLSEAPYMMKKPIIEFDMDRLTTLQLHLTDHAFLIMLDQLPPTPEDRNYILAWSVSESNSIVAEKYIVFTVGFTSETRAWPSIHVNTLAKRLNKIGIACVLLGTTEQLSTGLEGDTIKPKVDDGIDRSLFIDLMDKTTLIGALGIMQSAEAVIGVDNGLLHLAHCTSTPVVYGFTTLKPEHRIPARPLGVTVSLEAQVPCKGCQSKGFARNHDWRTCLYDDYACTLTLTADRFYEKLKELGVV